MMWELVLTGFIVTMVGYGLGYWRGYRAATRLEWTEWNG